MKILTDEEICKALGYSRQRPELYLREIARAIEAAIIEKIGGCVARVNGLGAPLYAIPFIEGSE